MAGKGNPNWCKPANRDYYPPAEPTLFELEVKRLGIEPRQWLESKDLHRWVERNAKTRYVPEWLLKQWAIHVEVIL